MAGKRMLILDRDLVEKIDEYRGDMTRGEFIELCVNSCLEGSQPETARGEEREIGRRDLPLRRREMSIYATREEFLEFKRSIRELLKAFLDFFITFGLEMGSGVGAERMGKFKSQLRTLLKEDS